MKLLVLGGRSSASLALSQDGEHWVLINASPHLGVELTASAALQNGQGPAGDRIGAVVLLDARVEHVTGLLCLAESPPTADRPPLELHATPAVFERLCEALPVLPALHGKGQRGVRWHLLPVAGDRREAMFTLAALPDARFTAIAVEPITQPDVQAQGPLPAVGDCIALHIEVLSTGAKVCLAPARARQGAAALHWMSQADCLLVDAADLDAKASRRPGTPAGSGSGSGDPPGMNVGAVEAVHPLAWLGLLPRPRKLLLHAPALEASGTAALAALCVGLGLNGLEWASSGLVLEL